jgi:trigger factor
MAEEIVTENLVEKKEEWHHVATMEDLGGLKRKIKVVYDTIGVKMALEKSCDLVGKNVQIKGFRKGKAPKTLIQTYCQEKISEIAASMLAQEGFLHASYEQKLVALSEPKFESKDFKIDGTFECDILVEVRPEIKPFGYAGLNLKKPDLDVEQMFERLLEETKAQHVSEVCCEEVQNNRTAVVDFIAHVDGNEISSGKDHSFLIQSGQNPPFGENLFGMKIGETKLFALPGPEGTEYAGKNTMVGVTIKGVTEKTLPNNEELAERTQAPSYNDLINVLRQKAEINAMQKERQIIEEEIVDKLTEMHQFDVPQDWVEGEEKYFAGQLGVDVNTNEEIKKYVHSMAERNVRRSFILDAIYEAEPNLKVTKEEFDTVIAEEAEKQKISRLVLQADLKKKGMLDNVFALIKHQKIMNFIIGQANIIDDVPQIISESSF